MAEVVLALAVVSTVFLVLLQLYPASFLTHSRARQQVEASQILENVLTECSRLPVSTLLPPGMSRRNLSPDDAGPLATELRIFESIQGQRFTPSLTLIREEVDARGHNLLIRVRAKVRWKVQEQEREMEREQWFADVSR